MTIVGRCGLDKPTSADVGYVDQQGQLLFGNGGKRTDGFQAVSPNIFSVGKFNYIPANVGKLFSLYLPAQIKTNEAVKSDSSPDVNTKIAELVKKLGDESDTTRKEAIEELAEIGQPSVPALIKALEGNEDKYVRKIAAWALGQIGPAAHDAVHTLIKALGDQDKYVRANAAWALGQIGPVTENVAPALIKALKDKNKNVRMNAAGALGEIGPVTKEVIPALIKALDGDKNKDVRKNAAAVLGKIGPVTEKVIPALIKALGDQDEDVRVNAIRALVKIGSSTKEVIPPLIKVLEGDEDWSVQAHAAMALVKIGSLTKEVISPLIKVLEEGKNENGRASAALALGEIGAKEAIPALMKAFIGGPSDVVRQAAAEALNKIHVTTGDIGNW